MGIILHSPAALLRRMLEHSRGGAHARPPELVLTCYGKVECALCDKAKEPLARVLRPYGGRVRAEWVDIAADPATLARWGERIPVILAGETILAEGKVSELRLRRALAAYLASDGAGAVALDRPAEGGGDARSS
ncbi:MAG: hypothetical protein AVDCRST_MAG88-1845 [uncultured Thermomicrobiales bacterium]|uniref:Glutaredoxin domain-containing protein n=1 Tax=uncultured Thermomicrobiales bacterium TaxID=1645740 RepID=A0A6J4V100_9BACT|nr:MAG: hypothetical protein AVDCRST_MAG88-1845 [uncultured Thermomicrobiales bacterium]